MWGWRWGCKRAAPQLCSLLRADPTRHRDDEGALCPPSPGPAAACLRQRPRRETAFPTDPMQGGKPQSRSPPNGTRSGHADLDYPGRGHQAAALRGRFWAERHQRARGISESAELAGRGAPGAERAGLLHPVGAMAAMERACVPRSEPRARGLGLQ